ncbi:MAG: HIT family protein [Anaerolineae bacterium]|nr:HIT family protein [Anaerolineae bacterium]
MRTAHWGVNAPERVARAEALLEQCAAGTEECIFCAILEGRAPASFIYRDDTVAAFMDLYPVTPGHLLIIPTAHAASLTEVAPAVAAHIMELAQRLGRAVSASNLGCDGFNLFLANGGAAGQDIFHSHLHILPRFHGDGFGFRFPGHYPQEAKREMLDQQAAHLRAYLTE